MGKIFVSYRRDDSQHVTDRLYDHLSRHFDRKSLFKDVDNIPPGVDFRTHVVNAVKASDVVLVVIGPAWLGATDAQGRTRIHHPDDPVAMEVGAALSSGRKILPVLVGGARMPGSQDLPAALAPLSAINALPARPDPDFANDFKRLHAAVVDLAGDGRTSGHKWLWPAVAALAAVGLAAAGFVYTRSDSGTGKPPAGKENCREYMFTDTSKVPPLVTKRWDCD